MNHADGTVSKSTLINGSWPCVDSFTRAVKTALEAASPFIGGFIGRGLEILLVALVLIPVQLRAQGRGTGETPASTVSSKRPVASTSSEVERYFQGIKKNYPELQAFLQRMPKGADLHNHLSGAVYAEDYIKWSADAGLCLDTASMSAIVPPAPSECTSPGQVPIAQALQDGGLYGKILRAWSMLDWQLSGESGHDHFFSTFGKFGAATGFAGEMLAKTVSEAAHDRVLYVELMTTPNSSAVRLIGQKAGWSSDFDEMRKKMLESMGPALSEARRQLDAAESAKAKLLHCGSAVEDPGCGVTVRYLYQSSRGASKEEVFALFLAGFELQATDPRIVGVNLVQAEDSYPSMRDFEQQMKMLDYLHRVYPAGHISLHAGELTGGLVPPAGLRNHIRGSVKEGHAERIGHGVDIMYEDDPNDLLKELVRRNVLIEICLTSNKTILGVSGEMHPLRVYIHAGVPVALATDDEGVSRSSLTAEFLEAVKDQGLTYTELKRMVRTGLDHAFLPGAGLWKTPGGLSIAGECSNDLPSSRRSVSGACAQFLKNNRKAALEWELEREFAEFEKSVVRKN